MKRYPVKGLERHGQKWRWRKMIKGRRISHTFEAENEAEAISIAMGLEASPEIRDSGSWEHEVKKYVKEAIESGRLSPKYGPERERALIEEGRRLGIAKPSDLTKARLQSWYDLEWAGDRLKESSVTHYLNHFRGFFNELVRKRRLRESPLKGLETRKAENNERDSFLTAEEVRRLRIAAREHWRDHNATQAGDPESKRWQQYPYLELLILLGCECGMRHGEIDAARSSWVDMEAGLIRIPKVDDFDPDHIWTRKGRRGRRKDAVIPLVGVVKEWFEEFGLPDPYLLKPEKRWGKGKYRFEVGSVWRRFMKAQGFEGVTIHDLRRSFGSNRVSSGTSLDKVANWMGIDPRTAHERYARFIPVDDEIERGSSGEVDLVKSSPAPDDDLAGRLRKLQGLRDAGLITEGEEAERRREILREI